jgi:hypothetical protein
LIYNILILSFRIQDKIITDQNQFIGQKSLYIGKQGVFTMFVFKSLIDIIVLGQLKKAKPIKKNDLQDRIQNSGLGVIIVGIYKNVC